MTCLGAGLPAALPRRASAYDVFMTRGDAPVGGLNALAIAAASAGRGDPSSASPLVGRRPSFRVPPPPDSDEQTGRLIINLNSLIC